MLFKSIFRRKRKGNNGKSKFDINNWMELTKEDRFEIDSKEKNESMIRKKAMLESIREEYLKIKNKKQ